MKRVATLTEIQTNWSICDLYDAHEALDIQDEADTWYQTKSQEYHERNSGS